MLSTSAVVSLNKYGKTKKIKTTDPKKETIIPALYNFRKTLFIKSPQNYYITNLLFFNKFLLFIKNYTLLHLKNCRCI
jgi:hypothetical protein